MAVICDCGAVTLTIDHESWSMPRDTFEEEFSNVKPEMFVRASKMVKERYKLSFKTYTKTSEIMPHVDEMFELFNTSSLDF